MLSNRIVTNITCDCYIREYYKPGLFELDLATCMTRRKSDPFDPYIRIDPTRLQFYKYLLPIKKLFNCFIKTLEQFSFNQIIVHLSDIFITFKYILVIDLHLISLHMCTFTAVLLYVTISLTEMTLWTSFGCLLFGKHCLCTTAATHTATTFLYISFLM